MEDLVKTGKILIFIVGLVGLAIAGTLFYNATSNKTTQRGRVVIFDGTSSAGKSSVIKELIPSFDSSYKVIAVDDFVTDVFLEQKTLNLPEKDFIERVNQSVDGMYDTIRSLVGQGKTIFLDTVLAGLEGEKSVTYQLEKLKGLTLVMILIYCPLRTLIERIALRNAKALQEKRPGDERSFGLPLKQFGSMYRRKVHNYEISLGTLSRQDADYALEASKKEFAGNTEQFNSFKEWFLSQLDLHDKQEVVLTARLKYDCIVNTGIYSPQEGAQYIKENCAVL